MSSQNVPPTLAAVSADRLRRKLEISAASAYRLLHALGPIRVGPRTLRVSVERLREVFGDQLVTAICTRATDDAPSHRPSLPEIHEVVFRKLAEARTGMTTAGLGQRKLRDNVAARSGSRSP